MVAPAADHGTRLRLGGAQGKRSVLADSGWAGEMAGGCNVANSRQRRVLNCSTSRRFVLQSVHPELVEGQCFTVQPFIRRQGHPEDAGLPSTSSGRTAGVKGAKD